MGEEGGRFGFSGAVWEWRGPAPFFFVSVPEPELSALKELMRAVTYGWGMIPATVRIGGTEWATALWPKDGGYVVPLKAWVRRAEGIEAGEAVTVELVVGAGER